MARRYNIASDSLRGTTFPLENSTLLDFWKWAFCDLCEDDIKGIFAEWVNIKLLKHEHPRRVSWANSDLITKTGVRIEAKATAYWQSYKLLDEFGKPRSVTLSARDEKKLSFAGLRASDATADHPELKRGLKSHLYVFALQKESDAETWDAMDLSQWELYVLGSRDLEHNSISLTKLRKLCGTALDVNGLADVLDQRVRQVEADLEGCAGE